VSAPAGAHGVLPAKGPVRHGIYWLLQLATRRRMGVTTILFTALVIADVLLWKTRPCDLLNPFDPGTVGGELLIALGILLRLWAAGTILKSKSLTTTGPYAFVRNPLYIGSFLMMFGFALLLRDWVAMWIFLGPILAMYLNKVRQEETYLARNYPESWPAYAEQTPRFVPNLTRLPSFAGFSWQQWRINKEYNVIVASAIGLVTIWFWHRAMA
jgi:protein-S-isoprenylcysteine O-methyltransferase Ste14